MTQENKDLLFKDLCARLPYGVKCEIKDKNRVYTLNRIEVDHENGHLFDFRTKEMDLVCMFTLSEIKPYLFPQSSMTEEQQKDLAKFVANGVYNENILYDWFNKNHFDYRGFIPMGLANDATGLNIY